jgi:hypothetical protein
MLEILLQDDKKLFVLIFPPDVEFCSIDVLGFVLSCLFWKLEIDVHIYDKLQVTRITEMIQNPGD